MRLFSKDEQVLMEGNACDEPQHHRNVYKPICLLHSNFYWPSSFRVGIIANPNNRYYFATNTSTNTTADSCAVPISTRHTVCSSAVVGVYQRPIGLNADSTVVIAKEQTQLLLVNNIFKYIQYI